MKEAYRVFTKNRKTHNESASFRSTVNRDKETLKKKLGPGPGEYEVGLPLLKPKF